MAMDQLHVKHFKASEFKCRCNRDECDAKSMLASFLEKLEHLRILYGKPLTPTSGQRCAYRNKMVGGAPNSQHLLGNAVDFAFSSYAEVLYFMELAEKAGFKGIGYGKKKIHIDDRKEYARWTYF
jgi:uncharacterized protein YcbK (DUF882 family)